MKSIFASLALVLTSAAYSQTDPLEIKAVYTVFVPSEVDGPSEKHDESLRLVGVTVFLTNRGDQPIRVPCRVPLARYSVSKGQTTFYFVARIPDAPGFNIQVPESNLAVVELRKDQTALISCNETLPEEALTKVKVVYKVEEALAMQHRLWHGILETYADNSVQKNKEPNQPSEPSRL